MGWHQQAAQDGVCKNLPTIMKIFNQQIFVMGMHDVLKMISSLYQPLSRDFLPSLF